MMFGRRDVLRMATAAGLGSALPGGGLAAATDAGIEELRARVTPFRLLPDDYPMTEIWGYGPTAPGPEIRVRQGERVARRFVNDLPQGSSIHWHGIRIANGMDGVSGLTQEPVAPGMRFDYDFEAPDAGTYWYHAHNRSWEQVARGLHGALIVEEATPPDVDREEVMVLGDWLLNPDTGQIDDSFDHPMMMSHGGRIGNYITVNGRSDLTLPARRHERLRLRLINASNARIFPLTLPGLAGWVVALDGMPLDAPEPIGDVLVLGPAQRADLIVDVVADAGGQAGLAQVEEDGDYFLAAFDVTGTAAQTRRGTPAPLPPNPNTGLPDLSAATPLRLVMAGGAMGRMQSAVLNGTRMGFRELIAEGRFWALNDMAAMTDTPLAELGLGEPVRLEIVNETVFPHAMHLHGMHFREVTADGALGPLRDTLLVGGRETREIAFTADNPGDWLFHCHMLSHAASGMTTWLRVT